MQTPHKNSKEHSRQQEFRIIDALRRKPMTDIEIAALLGVVRNAATVYISRMRKEKRIRVDSWIRSTSGRPRPVFGVGSHPDEPYTVVKVRKPKQADRVLVMREAVLKLLETKHTAADLAEKVHRSQSIIRGYIRDLRDEKLVRIADWKQTGARNGWAPVYKLGKSKDKPHPPAETPSERHHRIRADPEKKERELELRRHRESLQRKRGKPANPFAALGL
jgi:predicted ArsR family transcriptional regulator